MGDFADLVSSVAFLVVVVMIPWMLYRPPRALRELGQVLKEIRKGRARVGDLVEVELDRLQASPHEPPEIAPIVASAGSGSEAVESPQDGRHDPLHERPGAEEESESIFGLMIAGNYDQGLALIRKELEGEPDPARIANRLAFAQVIAFDAGVQRALADLRANASTHPDVSSVQFWLGHALREANEIEGARAAFQRALNVAIADDDRASAASALARLLQAEGQAEDALTLLKGTFKDVQTPATRSLLCSSIAEVYENMMPAELQKAFAMRELALRYAPADESRRFDLAFAYSNNKGPALALAHYQQLLVRNPDHANARNNLGVAADELKLPILRVRSYRAAEGEGNTLAMANLAYLLMNAGFLPEASELLSRAQAHPDVHRNVLRAIGDLADAQQKEEDRLAELSKKVETVRQWSKELAEALLVQHIDPSSMTGAYVGGANSIALTISADRSVTGRLFFGAEEQAALTGVMEGAAILFTWRSVPKDKEPKSNLFLQSLLLTKTGHGLLIASGSRLVGYTVQGSDQLDPSRSSGWTDWQVSRVHVSSGQSLLASGSADDE